MFRRNHHKVQNKLVKCYNGNRAGYQSQLAIFQQNIQGGKKSFKDQITEIEYILQKLCCDILIITEMDAEAVCSWDFPGYATHKGHLKGHDRVRVSALVRTSIKHTVKHLDVEVPNVVIEFKIANKQHRVTGVYREWNYGATPDTPRRDQEIRWCDFEDAWYQDNRKCKYSCLLGDMNFDFLGNYTTHSLGLEPIRNSVMENVVMRGWKQYIKKPTRHQGDQVPSCLDHVYFNCPDRVKYAVNKAYTGGDHNCTGIVIKTGRFIPQSGSFKSRCWGSVNWNWGRYLVRYSDRFYKIFQYKDPNDIVDFLEEELHCIMDNIAPERNIHIKPGAAKWMTSYLEDRLEYRDKLKETWIKSGLRSDERKWRDEKKEVRFLIRRAKEEQVQADLEVKDLKKRWERVNKIIGGSSNTGPPTELLEDGVTVKNPAEMANILNRGFRGKVDGIMEKVKADPEKALAYFEDYVEDIEQKHGKLKGFEFKEIDCRDARMAAMSLRNTPSVGTDGIPTVVYKELSGVLAPYLAYLINQIFRTSIYPKRWSEGIITPIFKKGQRNLKSNYRPVVINNAMSKIWERVANNQIRNYSDRYGIIHTSQHAYRHGRGCDSYWHDLQTKIVKGKDAKKKVSVQIWDLQSAFNLVQKKILLPKLKRLGFKESALTMMTGFLSHRKICTKIEDEYSEVVDVDTGSPEGCIISPLAFNLTLCDFPAIKKRVEKTAKEGFPITKVDKETGEEKVEVVTAPSLETSAGVYADDSGFTSYTDTEEELRHAIVEIDRQTIEYFNVNGMSCNILKSDLLSVLNRFAEPLRVGEVVSQGKIKLLGLTMTDKMSFLPHAQNVINKISGKIPGIVRMRSWASKDLMEKTAFSCLVSHMTFLMQVWAYEHRVQVMLQRCLSRIMRAILNRGPRDSVEEMMKDLNWLNIKNQFEYRTLFWIRKIDRGADAGPFLYHNMELSQAAIRTRRWRLEPTWRPQSIVSSQALCHRGLAEYNKFNLYPLLDDFDEYKELIRSKILEHNGNKNLN